MQDEKIVLRILNPDGSEAEKSGNGLPIFSRYLRDAKYVAHKSFLIYTPSGSSEVEILDDEPESIRINMGKPCFESAKIPVHGKGREVIRETLELEGESVEFTCVSIGNLHCVILLESIFKEKVCKLGQKLETYALFPNKINVQLLQIIDRSSIKIEIWERGAGYTLASGSSSCATAGVARRLGLVDEQVKVHMQGGELEIMFTPDNQIYMTGTVTAISRGHFMEDFLKKLSSRED